MTTQSDIKKLAEQMAGSMNSFDDIKIGFLLSSSKPVSDVMSLANVQRAVLTFDLVAWP